MKECNLPFSICAHECEELWNNVAFILLDFNFVRENKLEEHPYVVSILVKTEQDFWLLVVHIA